MKKNKYLYYLLFVSITLYSCAKETLPKPKAFLRLNYENIDDNYKKININCPFTFEISNIANLSLDDKCWVTIKYPTLKATLNITYRPVEKNLNVLLQESEKLTYNHAIKAEGISSQPYDNITNETYGSLSEVTGNAASPLQFYLTDSIRHFVNGALYFEVQPNYDSILPAVKFIEKDIKHLMETLEWNNNNIQ
jgi:gliding motility-associated lipoprotein GldD